MTNLLNLAGLGAIGGVLASSWRTIQGQLSKIMQLIFVSTTIHTRLLESYSYQFIVSNYKISFLDGREFIRDHNGGYCKYYLINNSFIKGKRLSFFWVSLDGRKLKINYIRGFFNVKDFITKFDDFCTEQFNKDAHLCKPRPRSARIEYINSVTAKEKNDSSKSGTIHRMDSSPADINMVNIHEALNKEDRIYLIGEPSKNHEFKHNYIVPQYLEPTVNQFMDWANPDINYLFKNSLELSSAKGFAFYGKPGTGKSSLIRFLAEKAGGLVINIIQLNTISATDLIEYFRSSKDNNVIRVIEDIDSVFDLRTKVDNRLTSSDLTFDVLLNCISGVDSPTAGFTIITTNHLEKVDPALLRAGRLDNIIEIRVPDEIDYINMFDARLNSLVNIFDLLEAEESYRITCNLDALSKEEYNNLISDIDDIKPAVVKKAVASGHTTAQFDLDLKNKISELYLKYRKPRTRTLEV